MDANEFEDLSALSRNYGNEICADCKRIDWVDRNSEKKILFGKKKPIQTEDEKNRKATEFVNKHFGVFLCEDCANEHKHLGEVLGDVASIDSCVNDVAVIEKCKEVGNEKLNSSLESALPLYYVKPIPRIYKTMSTFHRKFILDKYKVKAFTDDKKGEYKFRMPEAINEFEGHLLKGKNSWTKTFFLLHHLWFNLYENPMEQFPVLKIEVTSILEEYPVHIPSKNESESTFGIFMKYKTGKDGKEKEKGMVIKAPDIVNMNSMIESLRKAKYFYSDPKNLPKIYKVPVVDRISNLMIRNSPIKGDLEKRTSRNLWIPRHFAVVGPSLYYFKKQDDTKPSGMIPLHNTEIKRRMSIVFEKKYSFALVTDSRSFFFAAKDGDQLTEWVTKLKDLQRDYPIRRNCDFSQKVKAADDKDDHGEKN